MEEKITRRYFVPSQFVKRKPWVDSETGVSFKIFQAVNLESYDLDTIFCPLENFVALGLGQIIKRGYQMVELGFVQGDNDRETLSTCLSLGTAEINLIPV